jgi:hypothetical protein
MKQYNIQRNIKQTDSIQNDNEVFSRLKEKELGYSSSVGAPASQGEALNSIFSITKKQK